VDIDAQAACDSTVATPGEWQCGGDSQYCIVCDFIKLYKLCFLGVACSSVVKMEEEVVWDENEIFFGSDSVH